MLSMSTFGGDSPPGIKIPAEQMEIHRKAVTGGRVMKEQGTVAVMDLANEVNGLP